jgi:hypothetical protein
MLLVPLFLLLGSSCLIPNRTTCKPKIPTNAAAKIVSQNIRVIAGLDSSDFASRLDFYLGRSVADIVSGNLSHRARMQA